VIDINFNPCSRCVLTLAVMLAGPWSPFSTSATEGSQSDAHLIAFLLEQILPFQNTLPSRNSNSSDKFFFAEHIGGGSGHSSQPAQIKTLSQQQNSRSFGRKRLQHGLQKTYRRNNDSDDGMMGMKIYEETLVPNCNSPWTNPWGDCYLAVRVSGSLIGKLKLIFSLRNRCLRILSLKFDGGPLTHINTDLGVLWSNFGPALSGVLWSNFGPALFKSPKTCSSNTFLVNNWSTQFVCGVSERSLKPATTQQTMTQRVSASQCACVNKSSTQFVCGVSERSLKPATTQQTLTQRVGAFQCASCQQMVNAVRLRCFRKIAETRHNSTDYDSACGVCQQTKPTWKRSNSNLSAPSSCQDEEVWDFVPFRLTVIELCCIF